MQYYKFDDCFKLYQSKQYFKLNTILPNAYIEDAERMMLNALIQNKFNYIKNSTELTKTALEFTQNETVLRELRLVQADNFYKAGAYGKAAEMYRKLLQYHEEKFEPKEIREIKNGILLWESARDVPPQTVEKKGDITLEWIPDKANLKTFISDAGTPFVFDTGANLSVVCESTAAKLNMEIIPAGVEIGAITGGKVRADLAVAKELKFKELTFKNVLFLVFKDEDLYFPSVDYQIHAILGYPAIEGMQDFFIEKTGLFVPEKLEGIQFPPPNLAMDELLPLINVEFENTALPFSFDTGAAKTILFKLFYENYKDKIHLDEAEIKLGGAGGSQTYTGSKIGILPLTIGGQTANLKGIEVLQENTMDKDKYVYGNLGQDYIQQFDSLLISFSNMYVSFQ